VKVIDSTGVVDFADAICGINWVGNWPAFFIKVASLAFSGPGADDGSCGSVNADALHVAICKATSHLGLTFVAAAGNQAQDFATIVPAAYDEVLTVTGMVDTDGLPGMRGPLPSCYIGEIDDRCAATISNYATTAADKLHTIAAPSLCVRGAAMGYNTTTTMSGTSMAVPHVVGTLAVCWGTLNNGYPGGWDSQRGPCWGQSSAWIRNYIISESANWNNANEDWGFLGDPNHWLSGAPLGAYYGYLVWAGGFFTG
jgi:subtilisin family serine protease